MNLKEVEEILNDVANQISDPNSNSTFGSDVVARIESYRNYDSRPSNASSWKKFYHRDAILRAIPTIKTNGWYVWSHEDYEGVLSVWVTKSSVCPHDWYSRM